MDADSSRSLHGPSLTAKLGLALGLVGTGLVAFLLLWLGPQSTRSFESRAEQLITRSADAMHGISADGVTQSRELLQSLIEHTTDARSRMLADLPLALYAGDVEALREAVRVRDEARGARQRANVELLSAEMTRRTEARIAEEVERISADSQALASSFAADLRRSHLLLVGTVFGMLVLLLGFGLWRQVVQPVRRLSAATHAVSKGDLDVVVVAGAGGRNRGDEVGSLAVDFATMVSDLRAARQELSAKNLELSGWNDTLEREVQRKTAHLETALVDLRRAQEQLVQAARLASVGTLAGGIAHEFGNLIAGIRGCAREALEDTTDVEQREPLEVILRAADRAAQVTRDLLRFARRDVEPLGPVDLAVVCDEALTLLEPQARRLGAELMRDLPPGVVVHGDAAALHQVVVNLVTNALQALGSADGRVCVTVRLAEGGGGAELEVVDDGIGIAAEHLESVFDPFFTTRDLETEPFRRGTGLGLSVTYGVVESHGGRISVHSEPGAGARFVVSLPVDPNASESTNAASGGAETAGGDVQEREGSGDD